MLLISKSTVSARGLRGQVEHFDEYKRCFNKLFPYFVELIVQFRQRRSGQLLPKRRRSLPVEVDVGHGIYGVVSEGSHVVRV